MSLSFLLCPVWKLGTGNMGFPKKCSRYFVHNNSTCITWIYASSRNSDNHTQREIKIICRRLIQSGLQVILSLPMLIVACLLITSCESGVNLVTSCNQTFFILNRWTWDESQFWHLHLLPTSRHRLNSPLPLLKRFSCASNLRQWRLGSPKSPSLLHKTTPPLTMGNVKARDPPNLESICIKDNADTPFPDLPKWKTPWLSSPSIRGGSRSTTLQPHAQLAGWWRRPGRREHAGLRGSLPNPRFRQRGTALSQNPPGRPGHPHSRAHSTSSQINALPKSRDPAEKDAAALKSHQPRPPPSCPERKEVALTAAWRWAGPRVRGGAAEAGRPTRAQAWERRMVGAAEALPLRLLSWWIYIVPASRLTRKHQAKFRDLFVAVLLDICAGNAEGSRTRGPLLAGDATDARARTRV